MPKLVWDLVGKKTYETGTDHGVLYLMDDTGGYTKGIPWNGLTTVTESPSGAESTKVYADNINYLNLTSAEEFGSTIEAYTYPDEFAECDGTKEVAPGVLLGQQGRKSFGFSYRSIVGNDVMGDNYGYKLHLIYNCKVSPSEKSYQTKSDSPEAITFSWEMTTTPVNVDGHMPTSQITIDSSKAGAAKMKAIEDILYGTETEEARLPLPDEVITIMTASDSGIASSYDSEI